MSEPQAARPYMPGYGILPASEGNGLLPWAWAEEKLRKSRNFWVSSVWPDGRPHAMPVWGVWHDHAFWFSSSGGSRKTRNLVANAQCVVTTEDADSPVVLEGTAELIKDRTALEALLKVINEKYRTSYGMEMLDPDVNAAFRVRPTWAFGIRHDDFTGSPTRWSFSQPTRQE